MRSDGSQGRVLSRFADHKLAATQRALSWGPRDRVYYLSDSGEMGTQVWAQAIAEATPHVLTSMAGGVDEYSVSPDGRRVALIVRDPAPLQPADRAKPPVVTERFQFLNGDERGSFQDARRRHLYVFELATRRARQLTSGDHDEALPAWSPDGRQIAYVSKRATVAQPDPDRHNDFNLFVIALSENARERQLTDYPGSDLDPNWGSSPAWSPDGRRIAYLRGGEPKWLDYAPTQLAVLDLATGAVSEPAHIDRSFAKPRWSADGRGLYALCEEAEDTHLVYVDLTTDKRTELTSGARFDVDFDVDAHRHVVVLGNTSAAPYELFKLDSGQVRPLTHANDWLRAVQLQTVDDVRFSAPDGPEIHGMLVKPAGYLAGRSYPTIVWLHGGPVYQFSHEFMFEWQWFAANGYAVLAINPRGSSGRGFDFARTIYADWGHYDVADVLAGVDHFVDLGVADPRHLGIVGHSYGAMLTNYVIARDTRFKAAISSSGAGNAVALYGVDTYASDYEVELGTPWGSPETYLRVSYPFLHADRIKTPTLFLCSDDDANVPCAGAQQMYQAVRSQNVPARLVRFPDQGHTLDIPSYMTFELRSYLDWFDRFVGGRAAERR